MVILAIKTLLYLAALSLGIELIYLAQTGAL
jgi:hypothetical protein